MTAPKAPLWATRKWRLLYRLFGAVPADELEETLQELNSWKWRISEACGASWDELHGGGARIHGTLDECVERINEIRDRRSTR